MTAIKSKLGNLVKTFDQSNLRQRVMITIAVLVTLHAAWDQLFNQALVRERESLTATIESSQTDLARLSQEIQAIAIAANRDNGEIDQLNNQIRDLDAQIELASGELIAPERMPDVLQELLANNANLQVVGLKTEPARRINQNQDPPIDSQATEASSPPDSQSEIAIYRHDVTINFEGDYLSTLDYIRSVEQLGWRVFWEGVRIDSSDYPRSRVTVSLYTLSLDEGWIGV